MVGIGIVGIGFMGVTHFKAIERVKGGRVTAVFTRDARKLKGDWRRVEGNFGGSGGMQNMSGVNCHNSVEALLSDDSVDLVDICLPTHLHTRWTLKALEAGKSVLLEKPIALQLSEADRMIRDARKRNLCFMVAHVLRFFPEFRLVKELSASGKFGRIRAAHFKRITSKPAWITAAEIARTGGPCHRSAHPRRRLHPVPPGDAFIGDQQRTRRQPWGGRASQHPLPLRRGSSGDKRRGRMAVAAGISLGAGVRRLLRRGSLKFNSSSGRPPVLLTNDGKRRTPRLSKRDGFVGELQEAVDSVRNGRDSTTLGGVSARNSLDLCLAEIRSGSNGTKGDDQGDFEKDGGQMTQRRPLSVGILANPAAGRDIRRLVAQASVFPIAEKCNMIIRILSGLGACGVEEVYMMPDAGGIARRLRRAKQTPVRPLWPRVTFLDMPIEDGPADTLLATQRMVAAGVRGHHRARRGRNPSPRGAGLGGHSAYSALHRNQ